MMKSVLILDDEDSYRKLICEIFGGKRYQCSEASNPVEARALLKTNNFDLILSDINMPGESGLDFVRFSLAEYPDTAVIMVTGINSPLIAKQALSIGVYGYVIKPFERNQVLIAAENAFKRLALEKEKKAHIKKLDAIIQERTAELRNKLRELKETKNKLEKSEMEFRSIFENIHESYYRADMQGRLIMANPATIKMLGYASFDEINGIEMKSLYADPSQRDVLLRDVKKKGSLTNYELALLKKDGTEISIMANTHLLFDANNEPVSIEGTLSDITERQALESQLAQARKLESVGQLAAGIAHEINTPTQYVGDNTRFLQDAFHDIGTVLTKYEELTKALMDGLTVDAFMEEIHSTMAEADLDYLKNEIPIAIEQTLEGVEHVSEIVRSMKEFSHPGIIEKTAIDINRAIENTVLVSRNEWKYVAEVETDLELTLPLVPCLPGELNQVFLNIIINAAQAIGDVVGDGSSGKGSIRISTRKIADDVEICINDTGTGVPEDIRARIFDPFFTTKEVGKGTGQGLAISRSVIEEKHGGHLRLETIAGKGATFTIRLPLEDEHF